MLKCLGGRVSEWKNVGCVKKIWVAKSLGGKSVTWIKVWVAKSLEWINILEANSRGVKMSVFYWVEKCC